MPVVPSRSVTTVRSVIASGDGVQPHRSLEAVVVEEVVEVALPTLPRPVVLDDAGRDRLPREDVVDPHSEPDRCPGFDVFGDVDVEGQVAALMGRDLDIVDEDSGGMRYRLEVQGDALPTPPSGHETSR